MHCKARAQPRAPSTCARMVNNRGKVCAVGGRQLSERLAGPFGWYRVHIKAGIKQWTLHGISEPWSCPRCIDLTLS